MDHNFLLVIQIYSARSCKLYIASDIRMRCAQYKSQVL
jgi:hypothetical protein